MGYNNEKAIVLVNLCCLVKQRDFISLFNLIFSQLYMENSNYH